MLALLAENWWAFVLRGIFAILFGIAAVSFPGLTVLILVVLFGFYCLVDGFTSLLLARTSAPSRVEPFRAVTGEPLSLTPWPTAPTTFFPAAGL